VQVFIDFPQAQSQEAGAVFFVASG
jgi:hypothetical protein